MPKIIKDVENTIRNCARELFTELSYTNVDMKMISGKSGIAVGTMYNYYKNKKQLYLSILDESWQDTFDKLDAISMIDKSSEEKLSMFISTLYEDIEARNGLGKALINASDDELKDDEEINDLKKRLTVKVENFFSCFDKAEALNEIPDIDTRLAGSLLAALLAMLEFMPKDKKDNISFLINFISLSLKYKH